MLAGAGVEIPAEIVETDRRVSDEFADFRSGFVFQKVEADDDIGNLNAGIIDVILDFHLAAGGAQHADERIAQHRVAEVADVRRFIGVDVRVFHDHFTGGLRGRGDGQQQTLRVTGAVKADVDITAASEFYGGDAAYGADIIDQFLGDFARRLLELLRQLKSHGQGQFAEAELFGLFDDNGKGDAIARGYVLLKLMLNLFFYRLKHRLHCLTLRVGWVSEERTAVFPPVSETAAKGL